MNLLLFTQSDKSSDTQITLSDRRFEHLRNVLGAQPGDALKVGEINGQTGVATIVDINTVSATLNVALDQPPPEKLPLSIILALPRPKMLRRILRAIAELGVAELHLINSYRVEKSYWQTPALTDSTIHGYLLQGLEQARDTVLPQVFTHRRFKPFVEDQLPGHLETRNALLAHPGAYPPCPQNIDQPTALVIGPEGGFIPYEIDKLTDAGCTPVSLGPRILRVETALLTAVGKLT